MRVAYLVHDVNDPAVHRRIRMLRIGGAVVRLLGFSRDATKLPEALQPVVLGYTRDARMVQRVVAVARAMLTMPRWKSALADADVIMARQLETLLLAAIARRIAGSRAPLIYECLDIHRLMLKPGLVRTILRAIESALLRQCDAVMVSSERFIDAYFSRAHARLPRIELVENKVLEAELENVAALPVQRARPRPPAPPWRIGWFGIMRCRRSLELLSGLARALPGRVEITIRGRVSPVEIPDFDEIVSATPGLFYGGPYDRMRDLPDLYTTPHFFWAIDFFDGDSSAWLLPNRLYEGGLFASVPLVRQSTETARWLRSHGAGILLEDDLENSLTRFFTELDWEGFLAAQHAMASVPVGAFLYDAADCTALATRLLFGADRTVPRADSSAQPAHATL
jgi:succinoglycan biosynthesis protein ExoL